MSDTLRFILIQVTMWGACFLQFFLLVPDVIKIIKTRNTLDEKRGKFIVWFGCSILWIIYAILLISSVPITEVIGLVCSESVNVLCIIYILIMKITNVKKAKNLHMTEKEWYSIYIKKKEEKKRLRKMYGTSDIDKIRDIKRDRTHLIKMLKRIGKDPENQPLMEKRILKSKIYHERVKTEFKHFSTILDHFLDSMDAAEIATFYGLTVKDLANRKFDIKLKRKNGKIVAKTIEKSV